jgi:ornithine cyclodeaminase/alanine dehydrogenase-like protein (mu-crystallin family)
MDPAAWLEAVETGFRAAALGDAQGPPPMTLEGESGAFHAKGASLRLGRLWVALKLNGNFPDNPQARGLPTIQGAILLCDGETGALLAILDSIEVTLRRTAAATALAARYLARPDSETILVCGCGAQGRAQLAALRHVLPLRRAYAWDRDCGRARAFARDMGGPGLAVEPIENLAAARASDVIVACTTSRTAYLGPSLVRPGTFVAAVGADSPEKSEVEPALMAAALVVADVLDQCALMGDLHHAFAAGMDRRGVHAELGDLVTGRRKGRTSRDQITLFDSTGIALQDVASAASIYERAAARSDNPQIALGAPA